MSIRLVFDSDVVPGTSTSSMFRNLDNGKRWNGSDLVEDSAIANDAAWSIGMPAMTETLLTDSDPTGTYFIDLNNATLGANFDAKFITGNYQQVIFGVASPVVASIPIGVRDFFWNGTAIEYRATAGTVATADKLLAFIQLLARSDTFITSDRATELDEINANQGSGVGDYAATTESQEAIRDRGDTAWITGDDLGSGAHTLTITVDDGSNPLENATVRFTQGAETFVGSTNVSGVIVFALDNATWNVAITKPLFTFTPTTLAVSADASKTYSMTAVTVPASNPGQVTGFLFLYDENGELEIGVDIQMQLRKFTGTGIAPDTKIRTETSDSNGLVSFTNLFVASEYRIRRGTDRAWKRILIASDATDPVALTNVWGLSDA